jgi:hypothetical protein
VLSSITAGDDGLWCTTECLQDSAQVHILAVVHVGDLHDGVGIVHFALKHILWL